MNKKSAFLISLFLTLLIANNIFLFNLVNKKPLENVIIQRVIDGDTLELKDNRTVRLLNINSPEKDFSSSSNSISFLKEFENAVVKAEFTGIDKYGRFLARIYSPFYLNLELAKRGFASKAWVDESELSEFNNAEKYAIENGEGIWTHSDFYGCISSEIDSKNELVFLSNSCPNLYFSKFILKDESRKVYIFRNISFTKITLHSFSGEDNSTDIYWNSKTNIWNNDRDTLYLLDSKEKIIHQNSYGY